MNRNHDSKLIEALREGIRLQNSGSIDEADRIYKRVLQRAPRHPDALHLRALVCLSKGNSEEAGKLAELAIAQAPRVANFLNTAGEAHRRAGKLERARTRLSEAVKLDPGMKLALHNLSLVAREQGNFKEADELNRKALALDPGYQEALIQGMEFALGVGDEPRAMVLAESVARLVDSPESRLGLARYRARMSRERIAGGNIVEAAAHAQKALAHDPGFWGGWLASAEIAAERLESGKAEVLHSLAVNLAPGNPDARLALAIFLERAKRFDEAESHYRGLLDLVPGHPAATFGLGTIALMRGDYQAGWAAYEARTGLPAYRGGIPDLPRWSGQNISSLLLYAEQGLGDTLQMLRFVPEVVRRTSERLVLKVQAPLLRIVRRVFSSPKVFVCADEPRDKFDAVCSLMSIPSALGLSSSAEVRVGTAYLSPAADRVARFASMIGTAPGRKLGLVWQGAAGSATNRLRRLDESALRPILDLPGWNVVSLQYGVEHPSVGGRSLIDVSGEISDFEDLAAAMSAVDAIVSIDSGPLHLAGALGLQAICLLPWIHDWRWGMAGSECDWYGTVSICRQAENGDWTRAVARAAALLEDREGEVVEPERKDESDLRAVISNRFPLIEVEGRHGRHTLPLLDAYITRSILAYGEYSPREAALLGSYLRCGDVALDVGANLGTLTLAMASAVGPEGKVLALEPQEPVYSCLEDTLRNSGANHVEAKNIAAGATSGTARIPRSDLRRAGNFGGVALGAINEQGDDVPLVRLDDLGLDRCRLVKIDVEGMEYQVLQGATGLIERYHPIIYVECDREGASERLAGWLRQQGYRVYLHQPPLFSSGNYFREAINIFQGIVSANLLALPAGVEAIPDDVIPLDVNRQ